jgi:hypothetical protein
MPSRKHIPAILYTTFSVSAMLLWPHAHDHIHWLWWNYSILFITIGMVCISVSRFFGPAPAFFMNEIIGLVFFACQVVFFRLVLPSNKVGAVDEFLFWFDVRNFGAWCDLILAKVFDAYIAIHLLCGIAYCALPLAVVLVYLAIPNLELRRRYALMFAITGLALCAFFPICPGAGPKFLFGNDFPFHTPAQLVPQVRIIPDAALNTTPSGHLAWALLVLLVARQHCGKYSQYNATVFLVLTILATMGMGEHYVIDLVVAVPFAVGMWVMMQRRWKEATFEYLAVIVWSLALRGGWALQLPRTVVWIASTNRASDR